MKRIIKNFIKRFKYYDVIYSIKTINKYCDERNCCDCDFYYIENDCGCIFKETPNFWEVRK